MDENKQRKTRALMRVLADGAETRKLLALCEQWRVPPMYWGSSHTLISRLDTIEMLAKHLLD